MANVSPRQHDRQQLTSCEADSSSLAHISSGIQPINPDEPSTGGVETATDGDDSSQHLQSSCQEIIAVPCLENSSIVITEALQNVTATDSAAAPTELSLSCAATTSVVSNSAPSAASSTYKA